MSKFLDQLRAFHKDEEGAPEMSTVMIVALVAIPLVIAIILFGKKLFGWFGSAQTGLEGQSGDTGTGDPGIPN